MLRKDQAMEILPKGYHHLTDRERSQALKESGESNAKGSSAATTR